MHTHLEIAASLRQALAHRKIAQSRLRDEAGVSQRTLTKVLSGQEDFKLSTLFALADRLGLELLLVPKGAARAVSAGEVAEPLVKSHVEEALDRIRGLQHGTSSEQT